MTAQLAQNAGALVEAKQREAALTAAAATIEVVRADLAAAREHAGVLAGQLAAAEEAARVDTARIEALETRMDALVAAEASASERATTAESRLVAVEATAAAAMERAADEVRVEWDRMVVLQGQHEQDLGTQAELGTNLRVAQAAAAAAVERIEQMT